MSEPRPIALVAMGGHAFMQGDEAGTIEEHERNAEHIAEILMTLVERGYNLIVTHGNGPQVGNLLIQQEQTRDELPLMPLDVLVAMTEGSLGYILQQTLLNHLRRREMKTLRRHGGDPGRRRRARSRVPGLQQADRPVPDARGSRAAPRRARLAARRGLGRARLRAGSSRRRGRCA